MNFEKREQILFNETLHPDNYPGGIRRFTNVSLDTLKHLEAEGLLDECLTHNESPSIGEFMELMKQYPFLKAIGYADSPARWPDADIVIEGIEWNKERDGGEMTIELAAALCMQLGSASERELSRKSCRFWYD